MSLRPLAPLAVIGAGLLLMSAATRSASADEPAAPTAVDVVSASGALVVTWAPPADTDGLREYDLLVVDPDSGQQVLGRTLLAGSTKATIPPAALDGVHGLSVSVTAGYADGAHAPSTSVRVLLPHEPAKPAAAPAVRAEGRVLRVALPDVPAGVVGRVVRLYRDGEKWKTVALGASETVMTRKVAAGHRYRASYRDVTGAAAGPFSVRSAPIEVVAADE